MRNHFVVFTKLIGLLMISWVLNSIGVIHRAMGNFMSTPVGSSWNPPTGLLISLTLISVLLLFMVVWILVRRTEWLADKLGITSNGDLEPSREQTSVILHVGVRLLGIYIIATSLTSLPIEINNAVWVSSLSRYYAERSIPFSGTVFQWDSQIVYSVLRIALGCVYVFGAGRLVRRLGGTASFQAKGNSGVIG